jgi:hypothetical protein
MVYYETAPDTDAKEMWIFGHGSKKVSAGDRGS